jgi:hypothetical protein
VGLEEGQEIRRFVFQQRIPPELLALLLINGGRKQLPSYSNRLPEPRPHYIPHLFVISNNSGSESRFSMFLSFTSNVGRRSITQVRPLMRGPISA